MNLYFRTKIKNNKDFISKLYKMIPSSPRKVLLLLSSLLFNFHLRFSKENIAKNEKKFFQSALIK